MEATVDKDKSQPVSMQSTGCPLLQLLGRKLCSRGSFQRASQKQKEQQWWTNVKCCSSTCAAERNDSCSSSPQQTESLLDLCPADSTVPAQALQDAVLASLAPGCCVLCRTGFVLQEFRWTLIFGGNEPLCSLCCWDLAVGRQSFQEPAVTLPWAMPAPLGAGELPRQWAWLCVSKKPIE